MKRLSSWRGDGRVLGITQVKVVFLKLIALRRPANQWINFYLSGGQQSVRRQHYRHEVIHYQLSNLRVKLLSSWRREGVYLGQRNIKFCS